jgi:hypothetical protein
VENYLVVQTSQDSYLLVHKYNICYCNNFLSALEQIKLYHPEHTKLLMDLIKSRINICADQNILNEKKNRLKQLIDEQSDLQKEIDTLELNISKLIDS